MIIDNAGTYTLRYTATDDCGKTTTVDRELVVELPPATYRTVLYTDGTFIINESSYDMEENIAEHGEATNVYVPLDETNKYAYSNESSRLWNSVASSIKRVEIGSEISPTSTAFWFYGCSALESVDFANIDGSRLLNMSSTFYDCSSLTEIDFTGLNLRLVTNIGAFCRGCSTLKSVTFPQVNNNILNSIEQAFRNCTSLEVVDISCFKSSSNLAKCAYAFYNCPELTTIYASNGFTFENITGTPGTSVFDYSRLLVGGSGTQWSSSRTGSAYGRIDNPPDAPGYFTLKSA